MRTTAHIYLNPNSVKRYYVIRSDPDIRPIFKSAVYLVRVCW